MINKTLLFFFGLQVLFVGTGVILLIVGIVFQPSKGMEMGPLDSGTNLLLSTVPLTGMNL